MTAAGTALPVVGMVGAGQLARMTHQAAISLGVPIRLLADAPGDSAAQVAADVEVGSYTSIEDLRVFAKSCDVVTFDHEHVPREHLLALATEHVVMHPQPDALQLTQDKLLMRQRLASLGLPVPAYARIEREEDLSAFADAHGWPVVAKAVSGGYDGRGVWVLEDLAQARALLSRGDVRLFVEEYVDFSRELAALCARSPSGELSCWPIVETVQSGGICTEVLAPAGGDVGDAAQLAAAIAHGVGVTGVLAVELFQRHDGTLLVNELAMRPHNSGHWTIEGAVTSQFEQHVRAVLDWPLGATDPVAPAVAMANVLGAASGAATGSAAVDLPERLAAALAAEPAAHVHLYGKQPRPGRKLGHVTVVGSDIAHARARASRVAAILRGDVA